MTADELEDLAFRKEPMPDLNSLVDVLLYQSFRNLYDFAGRVGMAPEQGKREKAQILSAYKVNRFLEDLQESTNQMWKQIELASSEYRKNPSIENADKVLEVIYKVKRRQDS